MVSRPVLCRTFIGRAAELEHLIGRRKSAGDAHGGLVLVGGEPGVGKSRLIAEFLSLQQRRTARIATSECLEFAQAPLGPLDDLLAALEPASEPQRFSTPQERLAATAAAFERISSKRTTVVVIEDLHWAAAELLHALRVLAARAASQRLLFVASYRNDEIVPSHRNFVAFGKLMREPSVSVISLEGFAPVELRELLRGALGGHAEPSALILDGIARRSDGNPLFAEELLRHAFDRPQASPSDVVPISLHAIVRERLEHCSDSERRWLAAAALCGTRFDLDVLTAIFGTEGSGSAESLRRLCDLQFIVPVPGKPRGYAFRHALTRDALYAEVLPSEAGPLHRKIGEALSASALAREYVNEIAYHFWQSGERGPAAAPCEAAGDAARDAVEFSDAVRWYERAVVAYGDREEDVARVLLALGRSLAALDQTERAIERYEEAVRIALRRGDLALVVRARKLMGGQLANDGRRETAIELLERTLDLVGSAEPLRTELVVRLTQYVSLRQNILATRRSLARIDPAKLLPNSAVTADYYLTRSTLHAREGDAAGWVSDFERALAVFETTRVAPMFARSAHANFAWQAWVRGDLERARRHALAANEASPVSASSSNDVALVLTLVEFDAGRYASARAWHAAVRPSTVLISRMLHALGGLQLGVALADDALVRANLDLDLFEETVVADDVMGIVLLGSALAAALAYFERRREAGDLIERFASRITSTYAYARSLLTVAALRPDLARPLGALLASHGALDELFHRGLRALFEAELAAASGDGARAETEGEAAAHAFDELGWLAYAARAVELAGAARDATRRYQAIGHTAGVRRLGRLALEPGAKPNASNILTARQHELARLVAAGCGNRAAAEALSVSEKTVERHLTIIYAKLGVTTRAQLAAYVASTC